MVKTSVSWTEVVGNIMNTEKWVRNDMGMGRVQYFKLVRIKEEPMLFITSSTLQAPINVRVEKFMVINDEIFAFYDGEYPDVLDIDEYDKYRSSLTEKEWCLLFGRDSGKGLEEADFVSKQTGFYAEIHETIQSYMEDEYDVEASREINEYYHL